ncbi:MAG: C45 family autoproteolytic acyltransferase/hydrolase [Acidimicrobiaceae bacterium]|nr:C45 family autoproteolytic acyltransferase/hydrolase [Acidimicrobiaceae bacterium]
MSRPPIRQLELAGSPEAMGHAHGKAHADEIRRYAHDRIELVAGGLWSGGPLKRGAVLELAEACLYAHEAFSPRLHAEMLSMASAARITPAEAIVAGGFTDFVDTVRAAATGAHPVTVAEDDCTAFMVPASRAEGAAALLGQTWDMHDTATDHVVLARLRPDAGPAAVVFTTVGCLGQIGMNTEGVCVGINNLICNDGGFGVTWPTVMREMLTRSSAAEALDVLLGADLAGAHNYLILDSTGVGFNVEAMPSARPVQPLGTVPLVHTNHATCLEALRFEGERDAGLMADSKHRLELAAKLLNGSTSASAGTGAEPFDAAPINVEQLMELTREPGAICRRPDSRYRIETGGAVLMRPASSDFWACWGLPSENSYQHLRLREHASPVL